MGIASDLEAGVNRILNSTWDTREGRKVPEMEEIALEGGAVQLDATVLYSDLSESSKLATDFHRKTAAKVIKSFLYCASRIIADAGGAITAFDGDRVMGVFIGDRKNSGSAICALKINHAVQNIIEPRLLQQFSSVRDSGFKIRHAVGIDTGPILAVRSGIRGSNDIVWVGRAPNFAAKLSSIREDRYRSYVSNDVFEQMADDAKIGGDPPRPMWEPATFEWIEEKCSIHRSTWTWTP